jgi:hypothetical protein
MFTLGDFIKKMTRAAQIYMGATFLTGKISFCAHSRKK